MTTTISHEVSQTKFKVERINIHSDYAPFREWRRVAGGMTKDEAIRYHSRMKNSDNCVWRVVPE